VTSRCSRCSWNIDYYVDIMKYTARFTLIRVHGRRKWPPWTRVVREGRHRPWPPLVPVHNASSQLYFLDRLTDRETDSVKWLFSCLLEVHKALIDRQVTQSGHRTVSVFWVGIPPELQAFPSQLHHDDAKRPSARGEKRQSPKVSVLTSCMALLS